MSSFLKSCSSWAALGLPCCAWASHYRGFSHCGAWALGCKGLVAPQHVEFSQTRDRTSVPCIGRQILDHWITKDVLLCVLLWASSLSANWRALPSCRRGHEAPTA